MADSIEKRVAVVTGASRGIGAAIADALAAQGRHVVLMARNEGKLAEVAARITEAGGSASIKVCDVSDHAGFAAVIEEVAEEFGRLDILVNNAGIPMRRTPDELTEEEFDLVFSINVRSLLMLTLGLGPAMTERGGGSVINISSIASLRGRPGRVAYAGTKGAVDAMTRALAADWGTQGIRVNAICPGLIATAIWEDNRKNIPGLIEQMEDQIALKRWGYGDDIADVVLFFASDASRYVTGEVIAVDGGMAHVGSAPRPK